MTTLTLNVTKREVIGTGKLNALRAQGYVPGVIYGPAVEGNINVQAKLADVRAFLNAADSDSVLVKLNLDGTEVLAMVKDVQRCFLTDSTMHLDFEAVTPDTVVKTKVAVKLTGTPVGVGMGGVVHQIVHEMPVKCAVKDIPCCVSGDISAIKLGALPTILSAAGDSLVYILCPFPNPRRVPSHPGVGFISGFF